MNLSCAVLAGGESRRMGRDKALVEFDGRPLLAHVVDRARTWSDDVFVVGRSDSELPVPGLRVYRDEHEARTPLAGILTALRVASRRSVFVCATDMPFVTGDLVALLASKHTAGIDAVVPEHEGRLEPLHAVWSTAAARTVRTAIDDGERAVHRVLDRLHVVTLVEDEWRPVDPDATSFTNLNTPDELHAARG